MSSAIRELVIFAATVILCSVGVRDCMYISARENVARECVTHAITAVDCVKLIQGASL